MKKERAKKGKHHSDGGKTGRQDALTRAIVVHVEWKQRKNEKHSARDADAKLDEAVGLTQAIGLNVASHMIVTLATARPATLFGQGKVEEIGTVIKAHEAELVIVNSPVTAIQQRNLEQAWKSKVLDRTGLILEIFGERASTKEGTLQVELAHLQYQKGRLVRTWTHLERQRGGFGFLGGPGERQIEADRRLIQERIVRIERDLEAVAKTRKLHRAGRARIPYPVVALVGYTNAGKSTLFNRLTSADVLAKDMLFATLDPTMRVIKLPRGRNAILSDTVGFISDLPTTLIAAFRATLEEVLEADVILHVRDISHVESDEQAEDVDKVLAQLGIDDTKSGKIVEVWNKADLLDPLSKAQRETAASRRDDCYLVSAIDGSGLEGLLDHVETLFGKKASVYRVSLDASDGKGQAWFHQNGEVIETKLTRTGKITVNVRLDPDRAGQAKAKFGKAMRSVK